jgi:hypothetical protein
MFAACNLMINSAEYISFTAENILLCQKFLPKQLLGAICQETPKRHI